MRVKWSSRYNEDHVFKGRVVCVVKDHEYVIVDDGTGLPPLPVRAARLLEDRTHPEFIT